MADLPRRLEGRVALVAGGGDGIGRAICQRFLGEGAQVVCADINDVLLEEALQEFTAAAGKDRVVTQPCDVSDSAACKAAVDKAQTRFGRLDILVNAAALFIGDTDVARMDEEDWVRTTAVNLTGAFLMSKHALPVMASCGGGSIIHVASQLGSVAVRGMPWYCAQKGALIQLAKAMALDHAAQNIRVNSLSPGPVGTPRFFRRHGGHEAAQAKLGSKTAMGRFGAVEEIAGAAAFLASDDAAFMTGADLLVDGGYNAS